MLTRCCTGVRETSYSDMLIKRPNARPAAMLSIFARPGSCVYCSPAALVIAIVTNRSRPTIRASGVNTMRGSLCVGVGTTPSVGRASVGSPTGTVTMAVPFGRVRVKVVRALVGRKQYPKSTQLSPPAPVFPLLGVNDETAVCRLGSAVIRSVAIPFELSLSQFRGLGFAQVFFPLRLQQKNSC